eukprot:FR741903.1.p1 GENE.FR741903.1~~FR741903.1.p1  ORF type:complete len:227 (+),score=30.18 FR741903.1:2-682(+)
MTRVEKSVGVAALLVGAASALMPLNRIGLRHASANTLASETRQSRTVMDMGLFDGLKEAFNPNADGQAIDEDRETPFDRWMGISTKKQESAEGQKMAFVDSMDEVNYFAVTLNKPMGVVFEENDPSTGGVFVASLAEGGAAKVDGTFMAGDQLVAVDGQPVRGLGFDECLGKIVDNDAPTVNLLCFRGGVGNLYGNLGPSNEWLNEFLPKFKPAPAAEPEPAAVEA